MSELSTLEDMSLYAASVGLAFPLIGLGAYVFGAGIAAAKAGYDKSKGDIRSFRELYREHFKKDMGLVNQISNS